MTAPRPGIPYIDLLQGGSLNKQQISVRDTDVLIVGAGLAGLSAAHRLRAGGLRVDIAEASDRIGGRAFGWFWPEAGRMIDLGGTWILPDFREIRGLIHEFGLDLFDSPDVAESLIHFRDGSSSMRTPDEGGVRQLEKALQTLRGLEGAAAGNAAERLEQAALSPWVQDWMVATQRYLAGAPLADIDAGHLMLDLTELADPEHYKSQIGGTTAALTAALFGSSRASVHLDAAATRIERSAAGFATTTSAGTFTSKAVILAVPLNTMGAIDFDHGVLGGVSAHVPDGHRGASRKDWFVLDGVTEHFRVFASVGLFGYFRTERRLGDGGMLAVGLAPAAEGAPTVEDFEKQIREYIPSATIRAHTSFDWKAHPWARGTWIAPPPGFYGALSSMPSGIDGLYAVGGDLSAEFPGTLEGAVATGRRAAESVLKTINSEQTGETQSS